MVVFRDSRFRGVRGCVGLVCVVRRSCTCVSSDCEEREERSREEWEGASIHVCQVPWNDEPVIPNQRSSRSSNPFLSIGSERQFSSARMSSIQGPFRFAVADHEDAGGCHVEGGVSAGLIRSLFENRIHTGKLS
jgi:hypothetical protein